jgi:AcrR family transcriptional regulator
MYTDRFTRGKSPGTIGAVTTSAPTVGRGARDRLVAAAERLFYADGINAVGVDRLCQEAGVSKRSLYQHFSGKDAVVTAMLESTAQRHRRDRGTEGPPRERVLAAFDRLETGAASPQFRGCPFVAAAVELKDRDHPAAVVARREKQALTDHFATLAREGGARDPESLAIQLTLVFDGASAHGVVHGGATAATRRAVTTLMDAHGM